jgi:DNA-binding NarL/FixJ family response regulator
MSDHTVLPASEPGGAKVLGTQKRSSLAPVTSPAKVLIVEDDYLVAIQLEQRLQDAGFNVVGVAISAHEALGMAEKKSPAVAIMDIRLAGPRDGIETAIELQARFGIPSIFTTAQSDGATWARGQKASPIGWLSKPYSPDDVIKALRHHLGASA